MSPIAGFTLLELDNARTFYLVALGCIVATTLLLRILINSPFGHALAAARDNERRTRSLGFPVLSVRLVAFVISGMLAGISGYFSAAQFGFVAPQLLGWHLSATILVMVVLGGTRTVTGPLIGALVIIGLEEGLKSSIEHWKLVYGLIVIFIVLAMPGGVQQLWSHGPQARSRRARRRRSLDLEGRRQHARGNRSCMISHSRPRNSKSASAACERCPTSLSTCTSARSMQ